MGSDQVLNSIVDAAMFAAIDNGAQYTVTAMLGAAVVESNTLTISDFPGQGFIGFTDILFDRIRVQSLVSSSSFGMDNLQLSYAVPGPATGLLFLAGLMALGLRSRR